MVQQIALILVGIISSVYYCLGIENYVTYHTAKAKEKPNDLWCYDCDTMEQGVMCGNLSTNHSSLIKKCQDEELMCMVQRFSYTYSTENMTSGLKMWSLQRKCSKACEPSCIVIGERVKLFACTSCCNASLCNTGNFGTELRPNYVMHTVSWSIIGVLMLQLMFKF